MAKTAERERRDPEERLSEEAFLLQAQIGIQRLLNEKRLKYRDLSKLLGVSEARISQMFGEDASNLTIRTIARIYHKLDEQPVILTRREYEQKTGLSDASGPAGEAWTMVLTDVTGLEVAKAQIVATGETVGEPRTAKSSEWIEALPRMTGTTR